MSRCIDITGQRFGRLVVIQRVENSSGGQAKWMCKCDCGNEVIVLGATLRSGHTKSCGCYKSDATAKRNFKHGECDTRLYSIWAGIKKRVNCKESDFHYKYYAGKGIKLCDEWYDFLIFKEWALNNGYSENLTIDRIDPNGDYCPENCKWSSLKEQSNNKTNNVYITYNGETKTAQQWCNDKNLNYSSFMFRYYNGKRGDELFKPPFDSRKPVKAISINGSEYIFSSISEAANYTKVCHSDITDICNGKRRQGKGYIFEYINMEEAS